MINLNDFPGFLRSICIVLAFMLCSIAWADENIRTVADKASQVTSDASSGTKPETKDDSTASNDARAQCDTDDCEEKAPYVLRIINSGEGKPRSTNSSDEGKQDNRRADVTLTRKVPVDTVKKEIRNARFETGGTVWLSKDSVSLDKILTVETGAALNLMEGEDVPQLTFKLETNYAAFIERWEILVWDGEATRLSKPDKILSPGKVAALSEYVWDPTELGTELSAGSVLHYALKAYGKSTQYDQTIKSAVRVELADATNQIGVLPALSVLEDDEKFEFRYAELERQGINIQGTKVRLLGQDIPDAHTILIDGVEYQVDDTGRIGVEYILPDGQHEFAVGISHNDKVLKEKKLAIELDGDYFFMVALADLTVGENSVKGSLEPLAVDQQHYGGDIFVDGRLAFYLKGKIKGKYLITAQMDTGTEDVSELFDNFHQKDPSSVFRRLDPDQYYPVYGDDSTLIDDTDSQGKIYVRVDWDRSRLIWGNYNTQFNGTELAPFNRSLYGAQLNYNTVEDTELGDTKGRLSAFAAKAQSLFRHNEFLGTGGSLYYLRDNDIVAGSEKVWVEIRQSGTERVIDRINLEAGRDYEIDDFQGRLILTRPLLSVASQNGPSIIRDEPLAGDQTFLIVDYEYSPQTIDLDETSGGVRAKRWLTDNVAIGATWAHENREVDDYDIKGVDLTLKRSEQTFVKTEYAESESSQTGGSFVSLDGGLSFTPFVSNNISTKGAAYGVEARAALADFRANSRELDVGIWARKHESGFSTANNDVGVDTTDMGIEFVARPSDKFSVFGRSSQLRKRGESVETNSAVQVDYQLSDKLLVSSELRNSLEENIPDDSTGAATILAGKVAYDISDKLNTYGIYQQTLAHSGTKERNNAATLGAGYTASSRMSVKGEISSGDMGNSALLGTEVNVTDSYSVYTNYTYSFSRAEIERNSLVLGQRKTVNSQLKIYSEHQFSDEDARQGFAHTVGLDQQFNEFTSANLSAQRASTENDTGGSTDRNTVSAGLRYQRDKVSFGSKLEYRWDDGTEVDLTQWVTTNRFEYRRSPSMRWQARLNASISDDRTGDEDARFVEAGVGFAYRPVSNDRLNMLGRLTYLNDLRPLSQSSDPDERALITSLEGLYDLTRRWSVGGKLAHRNSEIRVQRNTGIWLGNDATLLAARLRYKVPFGVDATLSYHWLQSQASEGVLHGALASIGKRVGEHLTFSVGYNFTSFDDDLSNDSYDVNGWFVNLIGTY